jgi:hypothetical protein
MPTLRESSRLKTITASILLALLCVSGRAALLPGFRLQPLLPKTAGFLTSVVVDSNGRIYYTTTAGGIYRVESGQSLLIAQAPTLASSDSGLLGMALRDDRTGIIHYTDMMPVPFAGNEVVADVIASVDLDSGAITPIHAFNCDKILAARGCSAEHHGGNPIVAPDGSIYFGIGDAMGRDVAQLWDWVQGKIFQIFPNGDWQAIARGFRNPFDMVWSMRTHQLIVGDNGDAVNDEINFVTQGGNYGWPYTMGNESPIDGGTPPVYVFPKVVAPTGMLEPNGRNPMLPGGLLVAGFVTGTLYYFPSLDRLPLPDPIELFSNEIGPLIDVAQSVGGDLIVASGLSIDRLVLPQRGDCNGDGRVDAADMAALILEVNDGGPHPALAAPGGSYPGSWGCDVNGDGIIDARDILALQRILNPHPRSAKRF